MAINTTQPLANSFKGGGTTWPTSGIYDFNYWGQAVTGRRDSPDKDWTTASGLRSVLYWGTSRLGAQISVGGNTFIDTSKLGKVGPTGFIERGDDILGWKSFFDWKSGSTVTNPMAAKTTTPKPATTSALTTGLDTAMRYIDTLTSQFNTIKGSVLGTIVRTTEPVAPQPIPGTGGMSTQTIAIIVAAVLLLFIFRKKPL